MSGVVTGHLRGTRALIFPAKHQALVVLNQDPPVANTWYTVLVTVRNVLVYAFAARQINDEAGAKSLEARLTIDGVTITGLVSFTDSVFAFWRHSIEEEDLEVSTTAFPLGKAGVLYARSFKAELRQTTAVGTNQKLDGRIMYAKF